MSKLVLISGGPQQLLALIALARQTSRMSDVAGIVSFVSENDRLVAFEQHVCRIFDLNYLGSIVELRSKIVELGFGNFGRAAGTIFCRDLQAKIRLWLEQIDLWPILDGADVAMSYRANLATDNLLLNVIKPDEVFLVPDGAYLTMGRNLLKRFVSRLLGIDNFFRSVQGKLYSPDYLQTPTNDLMECFNLAEDQLKSVYSIVRKTLLEHVLTVSERTFVPPITLIVWQNLYPKFVADRRLLLDFFVKIIEKEADENVNQIVVKPHPRNTVGEIEDIKNSLPEKLKKKVTILQHDMLIACPVEIINEIYDFQKVVGIASTALLSIKNSGNKDISIYYSSSFPSRLRSEVHRFAKLLGVTPIEMT